MTVTGSGFTGATAVSFGAIPATSFTVDSDTQITAIVPGGFAHALIKVTTPVAPRKSARTSGDVTPTGRLTHR